MNAAEPRQLESELWPRVDAFIERMRVTRGASDHTLRASFITSLAPLHATLITEKQSLLLHASIAHA